MNILLVAQNYYPFIGGVETHARQVAHELSRDHCVRIAAGNFAPCALPNRLAMLNANLLAPSFESYNDGPVAVTALTPRGFDRFRMLPIAARAIPKLQSIAFHGLNRFGYPWFRAVYKPRLEKLIQGTEVVHSLAGGYLGWSAQSAAIERGVPFVCTPFVHPGQWGDGPEDIDYYRRADAVIGLVDTDAACLQRLGVPQDRLHVIGVSPELPETVDPVGFRKRHNLGDNPVVLYVGRMMPQKGAAALVGSAKLVWEALPETRFVFMGPAARDEAAIFEHADDRIQYLGKVSAQEKADALAACDVFCMPSLSEILPTVYLEAWSYGKPVVGGMAPGLPGLVEGSSAGLVASQDPEELARALARLLQDGKLRSMLGENGKKLVERRYSVPAVTGQLLALYQRLIEQRNERLQ